MIVRPATGEIYRVWKRRFVPVATTPDPTPDNPSGYKIVSDFDDAWMVTLVERGIIVNPSDVVRWSDTGWHVVEATAPDEHGVIIAIRMGPELEPG